MREPERRPSKTFSYADAATGMEVINGEATFGVAGRRLIWAGLFLLALIIWMMLPSAKSNSGLYRVRFEFEAVVL